MDEQPSTAQLLGGALNVVNAALDLGVTLTRAVATVTARGAPVPEPSPDRGQIPDMIHYGLATASSLIRIVLPGAAPVVRPVPTNTPARPVPNSPRVHRGSILRIPLAIENPGAAPMLDLQFTCMELIASQREDGQPLSTDAVRFEPPSLTVQPNDFEKLTVYVMPGADTAQATYSMVIGVVGSDFQLTVQFEVV
jgi:hypothetical protein